MKKHIISVFVLIFYANVFCYSQTAENSEESVIFAIAEISPEFPGGIHAFREYMAKNAGISILISDSQQRIRRRQRQRNTIQYPHTVFFVIERDSSISHISVLLRVPDIDIERKTIRVLQEMPKWTPAKQRGNPVAFLYSVRFRLLP